MTASPGRRRRSTLVAVVVAVGAALAVAGLAVAGGLTLYNSTEGTSTIESVPQRVFPTTPTAALGAIDDEGELASLAVFVGSPSGAGGSVVVIPVSADAAGGVGDDRLPIDETVRLDGASALEGEVEVTLGLGMDVVEVVDEARLADLLEAIGPIEVDLPGAVRDATGRTIVPAGARSLDPAQAAAVLTSRDPDQAGDDRYPTAVAVWEAIAAKGGTVDATAGTGAIDPVLGALLAGPVDSRSLTFDAPDEDENPREVDVVRLDRIELAMVFGQIAPGKMSAPNPALTFRIESPFDGAALGAEMTPPQVAYDAISILVFAGGNVLSVSTAAGDVPPVTQLLVSDDSLIQEVENIETLLGPVEIGVAQERIAGVDAVIRLGDSFLDKLATAAATTATTDAAETTDDAPETTEGSETTTEDDD